MRLRQGVTLLQLSKPIHARDQNDCDEAWVGVRRTSMVVVGLFTVGLRTWEVGLLRIYRARFIPL